MSWLGKAIGAVRAGRAEAHAATALYHLANLIPVIDRGLPAELRPELASKIVAHLDRVWEDGKSVRPDVDRSRMNLYGPAFLHRKRQQLWDRGAAHRRLGPMSKDDYLEFYSCSIAAYCLDAMVFDNEPDHGGEYNYGLKRKLKEFCEGLAPESKTVLEPKPNQTRPYKTTHCFLCGAISEMPTGWEKFEPTAEILAMGSLAGIDFGSGEHDAGICPLCLNKGSPETKPAPEPEPKSETIRVLWENKNTGVRAEWHAATPHWRVIDSDGSLFQQCNSEVEAKWQAYGRDLALSNGLLLWHDVETAACARYQKTAPHWWAGIGNKWTSCEDAENAISAAKRMAQERRDEKLSASQSR